MFILKLFDVSLCANTKTSDADALFDGRRWRRFCGLLRTLKRAAGEKNFDNFLFSVRRISLVLFTSSFCQLVHINFKIIYLICLQHFLFIRFCSWVNFCSQKKTCSGGKKRVKIKWNNACLASRVRGFMWMSHSHHLKIHIIFVQIIINICIVKEREENRIGDWDEREIRYHDIVWIEWSYCDFVMQIFLFVVRSGISGRCKVH